jgi:DNA-binding CsgD family transcriptional regulator
MVPLRGRETELGRLRELSASVRAGAGGVMVIEGAAGIGKSRLLTEAEGRAARAGLLVAAGGADELDQVTPWAPLLRALGSSEPPLLASGELASMHSLIDQRLAVIERMQAALEKAASSRPVLIVLDDLQWADVATLLALGSLPISLFSYPVGWLLALRPLPARAALDGLLQRLDAAGAARLRLDVLAVCDAVALARDVGVTGSDHEVARKIAAAEGNPFYILELLKADTPAERGELAGSGGVSAAARAAVAQHLRSLSEDSRRLLQVASVLGRQFAVAEVAAMTGQPASQLLGAVEEAMRADLLAEVPAGLAFRHDLLRQAVYESLPASARFALHRDAAGALERTGASAVRIAGQLAIGAVPGDIHAIAAMQRAVSDLTPTSPGAAAGLALRVLDLMGEQDERRPEIVRSAVHALVQAGWTAEALTVGERYLAAHRASTVVEAALQLELRLAWLLDRFEAYPVPLPARVLNDPAVEPGIIAALTALEQAQTMTTGAGEGIDGALAGAVLTVAHDGRAVEFATVALLQVASSLFGGRSEEALAQAEAALAAARPLGGPHSLGVHESLVTMALAACGKIGEALARIRAALAEAGSADRAGMTFRYQWLHASMLLSQGRLEDAHAEARGAVELGVELGNLGRMAFPLSVLAETNLRRGDPAGARSALTRYGPMARSLVTDIRYATALIADARGDVAAVTSALEPIHAELQAGCFAVAISQHHRLPQLVQLALHTGGREMAFVIARATAIFADQNPHVEALAAAAAHARALIEDDPGMLHEAVERAASSENHLLEAAAREDLGRMLAARSASVEAARQLEAAYDFYARVGAQRDTARVRGSLRALGIRKHQGTMAKPQHGWASLSRSELAVVELVAQGLTNREAAAELFLSPDTINTHLRHAFMKLGIRSRVELARLAVERARTSGQTGR